MQQQHDAEEATCGNSSTDTEEKTTGVAGVTNMLVASNATDTAPVLDNDQLPDDQPEVKKTKSAVKFQQSWTDHHQWLHLLNGKNKMFCKICEAAGLKNVLSQIVFVPVHCCWDRHAAGTDHQEACRRATLRTDMSKAVRKAFSKSDEAVKVAMKAVKKEHLALSEYPRLMSFLASLKCPYIEQ